LGLKVLGFVNTQNVRRNNLERNEVIKIQNLNINQKNLLLSGNNLAAELPSTLTGHRCFLIIHPYILVDKYGSIVTQKPTKVLNEEGKESDLLFSILKYEITQADMDKGYGIKNEDFKNRDFINDIKGIRNLENELNKRMSNIEILVPEWKIDNPI
jgi:hypothetical protein